MTQVRLPPPQAWTFARLPIVLRDLDITAGSVCHVGAHHGEEVDVYTQCGFDPIILVEPDPGQVAELRRRFADREDVDIIEAACGTEPGRGRLYRTHRSVGSTLAPSLAEPTVGAPVPVDVVRLPEIQGGANVLVIDTQGSELSVLSTADLTRVDLVVVETSRRPGDTAAYYPDAVALMDARDFAVYEEWVHDGSGYTDTVFARAAKLS